MYPKENGEEDTKTKNPASLGQHLLSLLDSTSQPYNLFYSLPIPKSPRSTLSFSKHPISKRVTNR